MLNIKFKGGYFFLIVYFLCFFAQGQNKDCSQILQKAQDTYKEGRIYEIADMLQPCLENGFTKQEKVEAYRLLTLVNLYVNEKEKAQATMKQMLKNDPEYKIRQVDPTEFVNLYNSFRTTPVLLIGLKAGTNISDVDVTKNFSLDNSDLIRGVEGYKSKPGIQGGFFVQIPLYRRISLITEFLYSVRSYTFRDSLFHYAYLEFPEKQMFLEFPVLVNYNFTKGKLVPYLSAGASYGWMISAKANPVREDVTGGQNKREVKEGEIDVRRLRSTNNFNFIASAGIKVKDLLGRGYLFLDIRYARGLNNVTNAANRYSNPDLMYKYLYVDNNIKINSFQYSVGYSYPLYKPKLKRKIKQDKI